MTLLLDTNVLSALARPAENPTVVSFLSGYGPTELYVSVITIGELSKGWHLLPEGRRKQALGEWISMTERQYAGQVLSVDTEIVRLWGALTARVQRQGVVIPVTDGLIAATAVHHGLRVVTRNTAHFAASGALAVDPWDAR